MIAPLGPSGRPLDSGGFPSMLLFPVEPPACGVRTDGTMGARINKDTSAWQGTAVALASLTRVSAV